MLAAWLKAQRGLAQVREERVQAGGQVDGAAALDLLEAMVFSARLCAARWHRFEDMLFDTHKREEKLLDAVQRARVAKRKADEQMRLCRENMQGTLRELVPWCLDLAIHPRPAFAALSPYRGATRKRLFDDGRTAPHSRESRA